MSLLCQEWLGLLPELKCSKNRVQVLELNLVFKNVYIWSSLLTTVNSPALALSLHPETLKVGMQIMMLQSLGVSLAWLSGNEVFSLLYLLATIDRDTSNLSLDYFNIIGLKHLKIPVTYEIFLHMYLGYANCNSKSRSRDVIEERIRPVKGLCKIPSMSPALFKPKWCSCWELVTVCVITEPSLALYKRGVPNEAEWSLNCLSLKCRAKKWQLNPLLPTPLKPAQLLGWAGVVMEIQFG